MSIIYISTNLSSDTIQFSTILYTMEEFFAQLTPGVGSKFIQDFWRGISFLVQKRNG